MPSTRTERIYRGRAASPQIWLRLDPAAQPMFAPSFVRAHYVALPRRADSYPGLSRFGAWIAHASSSRSRTSCSLACSSQISR